MHADAVSAQRWHQLSELIAARTGLHFPPERRQDLQRAVREAAPEFGCSDGDACADRLLGMTLTVEELRKLARHLTIGETYFFRERPSFNALATQVLPVIIHRKRAGDRRLRLWSAACSTGEEAYSLAMLLQQVLPDWRDWNLSILATDLNPHSLRKAEAGVYGEWSFRECQDDLRERFFSRVGERRYRVRAEVREMVRFAELNLAQDPFPSLSNDTNGMDLILCRNLLIYFTPAHAQRLIANLRASLVDDGWLIVSPSECSQALFSGFAPVNFPGSILYRKRTAQDLTAPAASRLVPTDVPAPLAPSPTALSEPPVARTLAPERARDPVPPATDRVPSLAARARALANQGALEQALAASERWIAADRLDAAAHYLQAMVLQELGERARARVALQRAVYLQPGFTLAHFALGNHARSEARAAEARRHFANARRLLERLDADEPVPESDGLSAGRLREIIQALGNDS